MDHLLSKELYAAFLFSKRMLLHIPVVVIPISIGIDQLQTIDAIFVVFVPSNHYLAVKNGMYVRRKADPPPVQGLRPFRVEWLAEKKSPKRRFFRLNFYFFSASIWS